MDKREFEANWHEIKGKIREKWGKFTSDDIETMSGKFEQFMGMLEKKYHYTKEKAMEEMKHWKMSMGKKVPFHEKHTKHPHDKEKKRKAG